MMRSSLLLVLALFIAGCSPSTSSDGGTGGGAAGGMGGGEGGGSGGGTGGGGDTEDGGAACDAASCPNGCCDSAGACQPGDANAACGAGGSACVACSGTQQCTAAGAAKSCVDSSACGAATCASGCCLADGGCDTALRPSACGTGGAACMACGPTENCIAPGTCTQVKKMFLTSTRIAGNFGGTAAGDALCVASAADAGLGGDWVALLANNSANGSDRLPDVGPWYMWRAKYKMFDSKAAIQAATEPPVLPSVTEHGDVVTANVQEQDVYVWTGTTQDNCIEWTNNAPGNSGRCGNARIASDWASATLCGCNEERRLYCFEK